jgi:hypothetical protein
VTEPSPPLIRQLVQGLEPVRPIPRLRWLVAGALAAFAAGLALQGLLGGPLPGGVAGVAWGAPAHLLVLTGLLLASGGCIVAALAGAVPGREAAARGGRRVALAGALLASAAGLGALLGAGASEQTFALRPSLWCAGRSGLLGLTPALFLCAFLARAVAHRPFLGAGFACVGAVVLGVAAVHASCPDGGALHVLVGHGVSPFALALVLALPFGGVVRRRAQRR